jgi:sec-independent protein translocase protein TatC
MALVPFPNKVAERPDPNDDADWDADDEAGGAGKMSFLEHLDELRKRIIWAVASLLFGVVLVVYFIENIFNFIMRPLQQLLPAGSTLIYTDPSEGFTLRIKIALIAGLIVASPLVFTQLWLFIAPGLYSHEKKWAIPFVAMSSFFFVVGAAFSHYVVFPLTWRFFASFTSPIVTFMPRIEPAFSLYLRMLLAFGIVFQMPTLVLFLARMGVLTARFMLKHTKYAILLIVIISAVVTPDGGGVSLVAMSGPLVLLYFFSVGLAWAFGKKKPKDGDAHALGA